MDSEPLNILLADDDTDDCCFFKEALRDIPIATNLNIVRDGEQLMSYLSKNSEHLPDVLYLDLSMPRKNGFECLTEIKESEKLKDLIVIVFSTSFPRDMIYEDNMIKLLLKLGAYDYIRKSGDMAQLTQVIHNTLNMVAESHLQKRKG